MFKEVFLGAHPSWLHNKRQRRQDACAPGRKQPHSIAIKNYDHSSIFKQ